MVGLSLTSCVTNGSGTDPVHVVIKDSTCDWVRPVLISRDDVLTEGTARQILIHNETWERLCEPSTVQSTTR